MLLALSTKVCHEILPQATASNQSGKGRKTSMGRNVAIVVKMIGAENNLEKKELKKYLSFSRYDRNFTMQYHIPYLLCANPEVLPRAPYSPKISFDGSENCNNRILQNQIIRANCRPIPLTSELICIPKIQLAKKKPLKIMVGRNAYTHSDISCVCGWFEPKTTYNPNITLSPSIKETAMKKKNWNSTRKNRCDNCIILISLKCKSTIGN